jgi:ectoine hydroxylase-related dioxygenase (phytanoyl-CoA dioxygenase family)
VEGSHKITNKIRGPLIQESTRNFNELWASKYGKLLPMKAGDAVFYHHGLLHFSPPNKTNQVRPALNLTVVPEQANCIHFCKPEGSEEIELYRVDGFMFYINYNHFQRPETKSLINKYPTDIVKYIDPHMKKYFIKKWCRDLIDSFSFN